MSSWPGGHADHLVGLDAKIVILATRCKGLKLVFRLNQKSVTASNRKLLLSTAFPAVG